MAYYLRTNTGLMVAKVDNHVAGMMIKGMSGKWVEKKYKDGSRKTVYVFTKDFSYGTDEVKLCVWENFYLDEQK